MKNFDLNEEFDILFTNKSAIDLLLYILDSEISKASEIEKAVVDLPYFFNDLVEGSHLELDDIIHMYCELHSETDLVKHYLKNKS